MEGDAAQLEELRRQVQTRAELRAANAAPAVAQLRADLSGGRVKLKADIKKSSAFVKKLKLLTEHGADALCKDAREINLTRYVSECVAALADAPLKMADLPAAVRVASLLHQRYADFAALLEQTLLAALDGSYHSDDKTKVAKRRILLRLLTDLYLAGVFTDVQVIATIVQRVARREGGPAKGRKGNMSVASGAASGGGNSSSSSVASAGQLEVPLLVSFAKSVGVEFLGVLPKKYKEMKAAFGADFDETIASQYELVPAAVQKHCLECFQEAYDLICKFYLAQHASLVKMQKRNEREEINRGEITEQHVQELDHAKQFFEKLQTSVNALGDALDKEVPQLPEERNDDELLGGGISLWEGGEGGGRSELHADSPFDDEDTRSFYEDLPDLLELVPAVVLGLSEADRAELIKKKEAARSQQVGPEEEADEDDAADGETADETSTAEASAETPRGDAHADGEGDAATDDAKVVAGESGAVSAADDASGKAAGDAVDAATAATTTTTAPATTGYQHQHDAFFASLEDMVNRDRCDKAAIDFCYRNSKANRNRLVKTLFSVPRTHLELLAYYARLTAALQSVLKDDIGSELVDLLVSEFNYHVKKRNQFRLESKIKNIRFIAELVKFGVCHPSIAFRCLKRCFGDFQGHNVYIATALLENCGRFLYCSKNTHARMAHFLAIMMKLKSAKHLDTQAETLVENAYYMCKPPERVERATKQYDPKYLFLLKLLYEDLNDHNASKIVKTLRKLPWAAPGRFAACDMVVKAVLKVTKGRVMHMKWVCDVVKGLSRYHEEVAIVLVDDVLEAVRRGLELNDYRDHQVSLGYIKLLGELFNVGLVNVSVVLDALYLIINQSHDLLSLPQYGGASSSSSSSTDAAAAAAAAVAPLTPAQLDEFKRRCKLVPDLRFDPRVPSAVDSPTDVFRIRLVCALVEACNSSASTAAASSSASVAGASSTTNAAADRGISKTRLGRFMTFFQRYVLTKTEIPMETDFIVLDLLDALAGTLKDHFRRHETWEDADDAVAAILRGDLELAERKWAKRKATEAGAATATAVAEGVLAEDDDDEDESEDDDDDDEEDEDEDEDEEEEETAAAASMKEGEDEDGDEDGDDDDDDDDEDDDDDDEEDEDDEEEEEEEEQLVVHDRVQKTEEDEDFEKAFKAMMQGSADTRKLVGRVNVDKMAIPTVIKSTTAPPPAPSTVAAADGGRTGGDAPAAAAAASPFGGVVFRMLRRGNKGKVEARHLVVPEGTSLAQHSQRQEHAGKKEQSELKRLVLQNIEREDFFSSPNTGLDLSSPTAAAAALAPASSMAAWPPLMPRAAAGAGGRASSHRQQLSQQQLQQQKQEREAQKAGYGANADWNNDEFGLRRGRGYRGTK